MKGEANFPNDFNFNGEERLEYMAVPSTQSFLI